MKSYHSKTQNLRDPNSSPKLLQKTPKKTDTGLGTKKSWSISWAWVLFYVHHVRTLPAPKKRQQKNNLTRENWNDGKETKGWYWMKRLLLWLLLHLCIALDLSSKLSTIRWIQKKLALMIEVLGECYCGASTTDFCWKLRMSDVNDVYACGITEVVASFFCEGRSLGTSRTLIPIHIRHPAISC